MNVARRMGAVLVVVAAALLLGGCGSSDSSGSAEPDATAPAGSSDTASTGVDETPVPQDLCSRLSAAALSAALGATVFVETGPSGDCEFSQEDARALRGSVGVVADAADNGGYDGYRSGLAATVQNPVEHPLAGIGRNAAVYIGVPFGGSGENLMAAGVADFGSYLLQVTLVQGKGIPEADLVSAAEAVLRAAENKGS